MQGECVEGWLKKNSYFFYLRKSFKVLVLRTKTLNTVSL